MVGNNEEAALIPAIDRIEEQFEEKPKRALADSGFHNGTNLSGLEDRGVEALIPARQEIGKNPAIRSDATVAVEETKRLELPINAQSKVRDKAAFLYQEANDTYYCPMGKGLGFSGTRPYQRDNGKGIYRVYQMRVDR